MPLISTVAPADATGQIAETYHQVENTLQRVPNTLQLFSNSPQLLENMGGYLNYFLPHSKLSMPLLVTIRLLVSQHVKCDYTTECNASMLMSMCNQTQEQVTATQQDPNQAPLEEKEKALLLFVLKSVKTPLEVTEQDVQALVGIGWEEKDILDATAHGACHVGASILFCTFKVEKDF